MIFLRFLSMGKAMGGGSSKPKPVSIYEINPTYNAAWFYGCVSGSHASKVGKKDVSKLTFNEFMDTYVAAYSDKFGGKPKFYNKFAEVNHGSTFQKSTPAFIPNDQLVRVRKDDDNLTVGGSKLGEYMDDIPDFDAKEGKIPIYGYIEVEVTKKEEQHNEKEIGTVNPTYTEKEIITVGKDCINDWMKILNNDQVAEFYLTHLANILNTSADCALDYSIYEQLKDKLQESGKSETFYEQPLGAVMVSNPSSLALSFRNILSQYKMELIDAEDKRSVSRKLIDSEELNYYWDILSNDLARDNAIVTEDSSKDTLCVMLPKDSKTVTTLGQIENTMTGMKFGTILSTEEAVGTADCVTPLIISSSDEFTSDSTYKAAFNEAVDPKTSSPFIINVPKIEVKQMEDGASLTVSTQSMHVYYRNDKLQSVERGVTTKNKDYLRVKYLPSNFSATADFMSISKRFKS